MFTLLSAAIRASGSLLVPGMFRILISTILLTLLILFGFVGLVSWASIHYSAYLHDSSLAGLMALGGSIGSFIVAYLLFPGIMPVLVSFFDDRIAGVIEARDYSNIPHGSGPSFWPEVLHDIAFSLLAVFLNILCLPLYLVPGVNLVIFYVLNGYLLGKEFFIMAARRYMPRKDAEALRRKHARVVFTGGVLLTLLATAPVINLIAPFWGVALMTHLFHKVYMPVFRIEQKV